MNLEIVLLWIRAGFECCGNIGKSGTVGEGPGAGRV